MMTLLRAITGEGWNGIMFTLERQPRNGFECMLNPQYSDYVANGYKQVGCGAPGLAKLFFYSYFIIVKFVFLNLFVAIVL